MSHDRSYFEDVTLLITHYNRSHSLLRLLHALQDLNISFYEVIVSDDSSSGEHLDNLNVLAKQFDLTLVCSSQNKGLGNNINKGQDQVRTPYTLYLQEDFVPFPAFIPHFRDALDIMKEDAKWDIVTFYSVIPYPYLKPYKKGYSEKVFHLSPLYSNHLKFYVYGDNPLLRRSTFFEKFGRYPENINSDRTELAMCLSFIKNNGRALFFDDHHKLLYHENPDHEPSTASFRKSWRNRQTLLVNTIRWFYLKYKLLKMTLQVVFK